MRQEGEEREKVGSAEKKETRRQRDLKKGRKGRTRPELNPTNQSQKSIQGKKESAVKKRRRVAGRRWLWVLAVGMGG
jgi:hypothetical protein